MAAALDPDEEKNLETYSLLWLDPTISHYPEFPQIQRQLRTTFNYMKVLIKANECLDYVYSVPKEDRIILIVSGRLGQETVPLIHDLQSISAIYVYCMDRQKNEPWTRPFPKIKRIFVQLGELVTKIREDHTARQLIKLTEPFDITTVSASAVVPDQVLDHGCTAFLFSHFLVECLRETSSASTDKIDLLAKCRRYYEGNEVELRTLDEFEQTYLPSRALWWYTRQSFLYRLLNKALRTQNMQLLLLFRFFLHDIERQLENGKGSTVTHVFFGQLLAMEEAEQLKKAVGDYISVSSFLATGAKLHAQACFAYATDLPELQRVLFEIEADPRLANIKAFANITAHSYFPNDEQTLFMPGTIFRLASIQIEREHVWVVRLVLCSENDGFLRALLQEQVNPSALSFGQAFCRWGRLNDAEQYYRHMLKGLPADHEDVVGYYDALGSLDKTKGDYQSALEWFNRSLALQTETLEADQPALGDSYCNIGEVLRITKTYKRAIESFTKALEIFRKNFGDEHLSVAVCFDRIGCAWYDQKKYTEALEAYERALGIRQKLLAPTNPELADSYRNIADILLHLNRVDHALQCLEKSLQIYSRSASSSHLPTGTVLKSIGDIYESREQYQLAQLAYQRAATSLGRILPATDSRLVNINEAIERVTAKLQ